MHQITWDMRYGLPNQKYKEFVARYLLGQEVGQPPVDPFAVDVAADKFEGIYVDRGDIESEISQLRTGIILGPEGSGKTTLFRKLPALLPSPTLVVRLPLAQIGASVPEQELMEGKVSPLTADLLVRHIFDAYWEDLFLKPGNRERFLPQLRQDQRWMTRLRWFYQRCCPLHPQIAREFELMAWLNAAPSSEPLGPKITAEDTLRELVNFVAATTWYEERFGATLLPPYARIQVLVDGTERLSNWAITRLVQDAQRLYDLYLGHLQFTLFVDSAWRTQIENMECVRQGRVTVYRLPEWSPERLREILHRRLTAHRRGEFAEYDWGKLIPDGHLTAAAKSQFVGAIVDGATRVYQKDDDLDAPVHVLRIARGLVAACGGNWQQYAPPLRDEHIKELVDYYWKTE